MKGGLALTNGVLGSEMVTTITGALSSFGESILSNYVAILPAIAVLAAIFFVIGLIQSKVN